MRELIVAEQLRRRVPGGIGTYVRGLVKGLAELDRRPTLWASRVSGTDPLKQMPADVITSTVPGRLLTRAWDRGFIVAPRGFDVVHATSTAAPPTPAPLTVFVHDLAWRSFPETMPERGRKWHEDSLARVMRTAARIMVPSTQTANDLIAGGVEPDRIEVIPHGYDHLPEPDNKGAGEKLAKLGLDADATFLLAVGTMEPRKNLPRLLAAFERIRDELPEPWPLIVVGPVGWGDQLMPVEGVHIIDNASLAEIAALYERCRLLAYVPLLEGYGLPVVEAMSKGAPVVSTAVPSAGRASFEVSPTNVAAIAEGLLRVAGDDSLRSDLIKRGLVHSEQTTWKASAQAHVRVWESLQ